ncbi:hypothetical protein TrVFT333_004531 [Trichoderma virens FT-333]|nr:hypothetical protein TrVFT333_004531 [Trichoderma virens FT-333]
MASEVPIPGTVQLVDVQGIFNVKHGQQSRDIVLVPQPTNDPDDPLRWTSQRKTKNIICAMVWCFFVAGMISGLSPAYILIEKDTGISIADLSTGNGILFLFLGWGTMITQCLALSNGRRLTLLVSIVLTTAVTLWTAYVQTRGAFFANRILLGIVASPQETLIEVIIGDLFFTHDRGFFMGAYSWTLWCGAFLTPVASGYVAQDLGWRWIQYILTFIGAGVTIVTFFFFEETMFYRDHHVSHMRDTPGVDPANTAKPAGDLESNPQVTSDKKTNEKSIEREDNSMSPSEPSAYDEQESTKTYLEKLKFWGFRDPRQPSGILAWYNVVGGSLALILGNAPYNFSANNIGLTYLSCVVGVTIGCFLSGWMADTLALRLARRNGGVMEPEQRLWTCLIALVMHPAGCLLYGLFVSSFIADNMGSIDLTSLRNIRKVLVANRGEIAVRCIKACRELGVHSVAIITNADATSLHATLANEVVLLPGEDNTAYTDGDAILDICKRTNANAIIPGYGFLSENVEFANAVTSAGITFVGPSSASINAMGLKHEARAIAQAANVPVIPGTQLLASAGAAVEAAKSLGCPVMLKATGGGGGMGLQICRSEQEVEKAFAMVESRASTLFKNSGVFLEKYYPSSRHIEVQVAGNGEIVVAFGERECSLQRRHQKVIEECPSPFVERHPGLRERMLQAAVNYASQLKYKSVGTVEFLVDDETADFFFLEMNTRLQVEHGITELCYGVDLVHLMLRQADYERGGHIGIPSDVLQALEDPSHWDRRSRHGCMLKYHFVTLPLALESSNTYTGQRARVCGSTHGPDGRAAAQKKMIEVLADTALQGTQSNLEYLSKILESEMFMSGNTLTNSLSTFKFDSCSLQVIDPGVFTTIQDYPGRIQTRHGIPPSGPIDDFSARVANILVGNDHGVELLELTLSGPKLLFHEAAVVAICGAELPVTVDGVSQAMWSRILIKKGQILELGKVTGNGLRTYLAVKGGFPQVPKFLGSKSTAPELGFGGVQGRKLQIHDIIALSPQSRSWAAEATPLSLPSNFIPNFTTSVTVCCIDGPYGSEDILTPEGRTTLYEADWTVSHNSSRSGIRLEGPRLKWARASGGGGGSHPSNVLDYGYPNCGVNFTGEFPIIFGPDRPDLGGFVCPTTVCSGEMWKIGQLKPGNTVRFRSVAYDTALEISRRKDDFLQALVAFSQGSTSRISPLLVEFTEEPPSSILHQKLSQGSHPRVTYRQGGDTSIIVEYGDQVSDLRNTACVQFLAKQVSTANLPSVCSDPNFASLTVRFDPFQMDRSKLLQQLIQFDDQIGQTTGIKIPARQVRLPVCLDHSSLQESAQRYMDNIRPTAAYMPDNVEYLRKNNALETRQEVFDALLKTPWLAVAVGFYVGTPILFPLDPWHVLTGQKYNPSRVYTPSGSVGLGGSLVAIYPVAAAGGYQYRHIFNWINVRYEYT